MSNPYESPKSDQLETKRRPQTSLYAFIFFFAFLIIGYLAWGWLAEPMQIKGVRIPKTNRLQQPDTEGAK